jgi:sterol desaturase/sphingolipid hydroxylase (fatty acid hydroxylase superfamily)
MPACSNGSGRCPGVVQFVAVLVTADLMEYVTHRAMHEVPTLWRFHAVHHSVEQMDWMAGSRCISFSRW